MIGGDERGVLARPQVKQNQLGNTLNIPFAIHSKM
jgi:hypothetical protein